MAALAGLSILWLISAAVLRLAYSGNVLPGTTMAGISVGGADASEVRRALGAVPDRAVVLASGEQRFTIRADVAGLRVNVDRSVEHALEAGRGGLLDFVRTPATALGLGGALQPEFAINRAALARATADIALQVDRQPFYGDLLIDSSTLAIRIDPPRDGRVVDRPATARAITSGLQEDVRRPMALPVRARLTPPLGELQRVANEARSYLSNGGLRLNGAGRTITLTPRQVAGFLAVEHHGAGAGLGIDDRDVARLMADLSSRRDRPAEDARITAAAAPQVLDAMGDASWRPRRASIRVRRARTGRVIQRDAAVRAIAAAIRSGRHDLQLPVRSLRPAISTSAARSVRRVIGTFTTRFPCCEPRVKNIRLIARVVNGTIIDPGKQFSLNRIAGRRTRGRGFVPAPYITEDKTVLSVGGGVSQFSTTMYNAAYFAGLKMGTHQPHSFYIDRYPAGREATLDYGTIDLSWTNDTRVHILVRASSTPTTVTVTLYGANGGRRVRATAGPRSPIPGRDFAITVTRTINYADGRVVRQPYTTAYDEPPAR